MMKTVILLVATTILTDCGMTNASTGVSGLFSDFQDDQETKKTERRTAVKSRAAVEEMTQGLESPEEQGSDINEKTDRISATFKRDVGRTPLQNDVVVNERPVDQIFSNIGSGTRKRRQVLKDYRYPFTTWQGGVFYTFNTSDRTVQRVFKMGARVWSEATCIDFVENRNVMDKLVVVKGGGCYSSIGRVGGDQLFTLDDDATEGMAVHEIGHILGLFHTMQRYDRDDYITMDEENIDPLQIGQFIKMSKEHVDVYGLAYDYGSVMHYDELSSPDDNQPILIAKDPLYQKTMGSELISFSDIFMINEHYGCNERCNKNTSAKCANEGYPHPRNCSICICPSGYGGALCDRRPPGCGEDLVATNERKSLAYRLGSGSGLKDKFDFCNYMITAPEGKKIEVEVCSISHGYDDAGCPRGGVEVKAQMDQKLTGYRFCSMSGSGGPIVSNSSRLPVILFNKLGRMHGIFMYRYID